MAVSEKFYYDNQLRSYVVQFAAIFQGMQVEVGSRDDVEPHLIGVPVKNASSDRVVAAIKNENTQNKPIRLPLMSFQLVNIELAPELRKGVGTQRRQAYVPTGGLVPDDIKVVRQRMPVPYRATFELAIWASNQDQHYQIVEQILSIFDPMIQIQTSDDTFDWRKITTVELVGINFDENTTPAADRRLIQTPLTFSMPIYLAIPAEVHSQFIKDVFLRIGAVSADLDNSYDVIADLDSQGVEYDQIFSGDDVQVD